MDARFHYQGFAANPQPNTFKNLCNSILFGGTGGEAGNKEDTTLLLDSVGFVPTFIPDPKGVKRKWSSVDEPVNQQLESSLDLRLGHSSSSSDTKGSTATACTSVSSAKESEEESSMDLDFTLHLGGDKSSDSEKSATSTLNMQPMVDLQLQLSLSSGPAVSYITTVQPSLTMLANVNKMIADSRGLSTDQRSTENRFVQLQTAENMGNIKFLDQLQGKIKPTSPGLSSSIMTSKSSVTCTSGITQSKQQRASSTKQCQFVGCVKGARGASGLCIAHGGGRRCQRQGCHKGAEGRTAFCKAHGGGRRCEFLGCTKSAEGRTDFCIAHGGGRRCGHEGCTRASRGRSGLCIRHGGGKRCQIENCSKSAEGLSGLCISHGGGRRCQYPECSKGAQGSTMFCKAHGGGKRCTHPGCQKGAEGSTLFCKGHGGGKRCSFEGGGVCTKSVHGGTLFCVAHGGGKRCSVPECTKSARGRTDFCVRHGGGKRCKFEGCCKSAQGSTEFCKAHGGGKRCSWGQPGSCLGTDDVPCDAFARVKTGLCTSHGVLVQDKRVHGGAPIGTAAYDSKAIHPAGTQPIFTNEGTSLDITNYFGYQAAYLPPGNNPPPNKFSEGRVHGGKLMAMITGSRDVAGPSTPNKSFSTHQIWM